MSKTMKWIIIVLVLVIVALIVWWVGMSGVPGVSQSNVTGSASNTTGTGAGAASGSPTLDQINRDVANMDLEFQVGMSGFSNLGSTPTQTKIVSVAAHFKAASLLMTGLTVELGSAISNSKLTALKTPLNDMGTQIGRASCRE